MGGEGASESNHLSPILLLDRFVGPEPIGRLFHQTPTGFRNHRRPGIFRSPATNSWGSFGRSSVGKNRGPNAPGLLFCCVGRTQSKPQTWGALRKLQRCLFWRPPPEWNVSRSAVQGSAVIGVGAFGAVFCLLRPHPHSLCERSGESVKRRGINQFKSRPYTSANSRECRRGCRRLFRPRFRPRFRFFSPGKTW